MDYLLKSSVCLTAFYGLYFFGFRRLSFHTLNRFYLLASLALSLTIPMLSYEREEVVIIEPNPVSEITYSKGNIPQSIDNQIVKSNISTEKVVQSQVDWLQILMIIYFLGMAIILFVFLKNIASIIKVLAMNRSENKRIFYVKSHFSNSSFFNYIFLNPDNLNPHEQAIIIAHEGFHAKRLHTLDLLFISILKAIFWFNPIIYFYQKSLKQIHEYEVDSLMSATHDSRDYAHLLLKLGVAPNAMIINQFSTKPLSDRIQFLFTKPTKNMKKLLYFLVIPIIGVGIMAFAEEKVKKIYKEKKPVQKRTETFFKKPVEVLGSNKILKQQKTIFDSSNLAGLPQIDSTKFTYYLGIKPTKKSSIDSFKVIVNNKLLTEGKNYIVKNNTIYLDQKYGREKVSFRIYSTAIGNMLYPELALLEDIPLVKSLFSVKMPSFLASNENKVSSKTIRIPFPDARPIKSQDTLRTILETNKLGKNPLVVINGEEYPSSILYRLNPDKIGGSEYYAKNSERAIKKYGEKARDGLIMLDARGNDFLLKTEKTRQIAVENVKKQLEVSKNRVRRVILKDANGKEYEKVSVMRLDYETVHFSVDVPVGGKVLFTINGKIVSEEEVNRSTQHFSSGGCGGMSKERSIKIDESSPKYYAYIDLGN